MKITIKSPVKAFITEYSDTELSDLKRYLTYTNTGVAHLIKRHYNNHFWKSRNADSWTAHLAELQKDLKKTLVFDSPEGVYVRPGSIPYIIENQFNPEVINEIAYPTPKKIAWAKPLPFDLHPYQIESWERLLTEKHGNVSLTTGSGKSAIILKLCRELGLKVAIIAPGKGVFHELREKFEYHFGRGKVGLFGDSKKKLDKQFTICIGDSIANIKPDSEEFKFFSNLDALIVDESHTFAAESLEKICHEVLGSIPYRFFLSATQVRGDGTIPLLQSIIGRTVKTLTTADAVKQGYISNHEFRIVAVDSSTPSFESSDALEMKRVHFLRNTNITAFAAKLANTVATIGQQTLILVEELNQIKMIADQLNVSYAIAHSEKSKERLALVGLEKVDVQESIEKFNKSEAKVLIGTSCIRTGCNIFPVHHCVNAVGGASEITTKQGAVGRAVRFGHSNPWAKNCVPKDTAIIYDFDVQDCYIMQKHLEERLAYYAESDTPIKFVKFK